MSKARILANVVSGTNVLADGTVSSSEIAGLSAVATSGSANDLSGLSSVATSGSYNDLTNTPAGFTTGKAIAMSIVFGG